MRTRSNSRSSRCRAPLRASTWLTRSAWTAVSVMSADSSGCRPLLPEHSRDLARLSGFVVEAESAVVPQLACGSQKGAKGRPGERRASAHAADAKRGEIGQSQRESFQADEHVHRAIQCPDDAGDLVPGGEPRRVQYICAGVLVGL